MEIKRPEPRQRIPADAKKVFSGILFDVYQWEQEMFDGTKAVFEILKRPDTVVVFPILPDGQILLIDEEQPGKTALIGAPGGRIEEGEDVLTAAKRELLEETGYEAEEFVLWEAQQPVAKIDWAVYFLAAKGLKKIAEPHLDAGEKIKLKLVSFEEFIGSADDKRFGERTIVSRILEAKLDNAKMAELKKLFSVSE
ncbi:MAG: NUDIX hydrolase [bacterium]|nr:NUDIX hydrolase [bacterium]